MTRVDRAPRTLTPSMGSYLTKAVTPFLLGAIRQATEGQSLRANQALLASNARLAAEHAVALFH
jgi:pseudouridine-5'-phosphate glycosidase